MAESASRTGAAPPDPGQARLLVLVVFFPHDGVMDDDLRPVSRDDLIFDIEFVLSHKAARLWPRKRSYGLEHPYRPAAEAVVEHLELCGLRVFRIPPAPWHSAPGRGPRED